MRTLIVTGADEAFSALLRGLLRSLQQWQPQPYTDLAVLDLGLSAASLEWVGRYARHVVRPGWDLKVDPALRVAKPHLRALTARPFLRDYFPGYDLYLWLDSDTWVQEQFAVEWMFRSAASGAMGLVPEHDRCYHPQPAFVTWRQRGMRHYFDEKAVQRVLWDRYFNAGVFSLHVDAPHWGLWNRYFTQGIAKSQGHHVCDQTALNQMLWVERPPVLPLPALCNWLCHSATPGWREDRARFCEPYPPWHVLGIVHLVGGTKDTRVKISRNGVEENFSLQFPVP
ncbi:MAG: hypothetical protein HY854_06650 [Burkholderiales bacterium]|nr:hypothetical protein [Burkholderiales bacterium]